MSKGMCGRCYDEVVDLFPANCAEKPEALLGQPIGQYHCPDCGAMVMAGMLHPELCQRCIERKHPEFDSRPAAPELETPETDAFKERLWDALADSPKSRESNWEYLARSLERRLTLAQTEIKGHMRVKDDLQGRIAELEKEINTPEIEDFLLGVRLEAAHQIKRWGTAHDREKSAENWYWLVGYLGGKALRSAITGDRDKALHHCISSAAALMNWHSAIRLDTSGAGIGKDEDIALDGSKIKPIDAATKDRA